MCVYTCIDNCGCMCVCIYIYIQRERVLNSPGIGLLLSGDSTQSTLVFRSNRSFPGFDQRLVHKHEPGLDDPVVCETEAWNSHCIPSCTSEKLSDGVRRLISSHICMCRMCVCVYIYIYVCVFNDPSLVVRMAAD